MRLFQSLSFAKNGTCNTLFQVESIRRLSEFWLLCITWVEKIPHTSENRKNWTVDVAQKRKLQKRGTEKLEENCNKPNLMSFTNGILSFIHIYNYFVNLEERNLKISVSLGKAAS